MDTDNFNVDLENLSRFLINNIACANARISVLEGQVSFLLQQSYPDKYENIKAASDAQFPSILKQSLRQLVDSLSLESVEMQKMIESLLKKDL